MPDPFLLPVVDEDPTNGDRTTTSLSAKCYQSYQWSAVAPEGTFLCLAGITTSYGEGDGVRYDTFSVVVS